jgi:hypothetical protein
VQARVEKEQADDADEGFAVFVIDLGARRNEWRENPRIDDKIEHGEVAPVGGEERLHRSKICDGRRPPLQNQCSNFSSAESGWAPSEVAMT